MLCEVLKGHPSQVPWSILLLGTHLYYMLLLLLPAMKKKKKKNYYFLFNASNTSPYYGSPAMS